MPWQNEIIFCDKCDKPLSIYPIFTIKGNYGNICGRWSCRSYLSNQSCRNKTLEVLLKTRLFPCGNKNSGCEETFAPASMEQHEEKCDYGFEGENICKQLFPDASLYRTISSAFQTLLGSPESIVNHLNVFANKGAFEIQKDTSKFYITTTPQNKNFAIFTTVKDMKEGALFFIKMFDLNEYTPGSSRLVSYIIHGDLIKTPIEPYETNIIPVTLDRYFKYQLEIVKLYQSNITRCQYLNTKLTVNKNILEKLRCPKCKIYLTSKIFQCIKGHSYCGRCYEELIYCHICHNGLDNKRNFALENVVKYVKFPCENANSGCRFVGRNENLLAHQAKCTIIEKNCILRDYMNCNWKGSNGRNLLSHIQKDHRNYLVESNKISMIIDNDFFDKVHKTCYILLTNDPQDDVPQVVLLNFLYENQTFYWGMQYINETQNLDYEIEVLDLNEHIQNVIVVGSKFNGTAKLKLKAVESLIKDQLTYSVELF